MRITPVLPAASPIVHAPAAQPIVAPRAPIASDPTPPASTPAQVSQRYGKDLLAIPGAWTVSWSATSDALTVFFLDERSAALAKAVLEPKVDGVPIVIGLQSTRQPYTGDAPVSSSDVVRAIAAMDGVWGKTFVGAPNQNGQVTFRTIDQATIDRLDPIIVNRFRGGTSKTGIPLWNSIRWRAGVPA